MSLNKVPTNRIDIAQKGITIANAWATNHISFVVSEFSQPDFLSLHQDLEAKIILNNAIDSQQTTNSALLATLKKQVKDAPKHLKGYLLDEYETADAAATYYSTYGLMKANKVWSYPTDNDACIIQLKKTVNKLEEFGNPLANKKFGLIYFKQLRDNFEAAWTLSKQLKSQKTLLSKECIELTKQAKLMQADLRALIKMRFRGQDLNKIYREFGYLKETY